MSFLSVLKRIVGVAVKVEHIVAPAAEIIFPEFAPEISGFDGLVTHLMGGIAAAEVNSPIGGGDAKHSQVIQLFEAALADVAAVLAPVGVTLKYGNTELDTAIKAFVAAFNAAAALKASVVFINTPSAPPTPPASA